MTANRTLKRDTLKALETEAIELLLNTICYKPGEAPGFDHILYCRWCSYAQAYPHDKRCIVARYIAQSQAGGKRGKRGG